MGRPAADLVREWGPPTKEVDDAGQRVLVYEEVERTGSAAFSARGLAPVHWRAAASPPPPSTVGYNSYARSYLFWVDAAGKISRTQIRQSLTAAAPAAPRSRPWRRACPGLS